MVSRESCLTVVAVSHQRQGAHLSLGVGGVFLGRSKSAVDRMCHWWQWAGSRKSMVITAFPSRRKKESRGHMSHSSSQKVAATGQVVLPLLH